MYDILKPTAVSIDPYAILSTIYKNAEVLKGVVAKWIPRWSSKPKIEGSSPSDFAF